MGEKPQREARELVEISAQGHLRRVLDRRAEERLPEAQDALMREHDPEAPNPNSLPRKN